MFDLKYYGGFSLFETYNMPLGILKYYTEKLSDTLEKEKAEIEKARSKGR